jgi:hypothetical protein
MGLCNVTNKTKEKRMSDMSDMYNYWISKKHIVDRFTDGRIGYNAEASAKNMKFLIEQRLEKPWDSDSPLTDADYRRIKVEIDAYDKALSGKFANFAFLVPEGISKQDPTARKFYLRLNEILDYERVQVNKVLTSNSYIANHMLDAYISEFGTTKRKGDLAMKELKQLRKEMSEADPNEHVQAEFVNKIEEFVNSDQGRTIKQFIDLVHMDNDTFTEARKPSYRNEQGDLVNFNSHVYKAVEVARQNLKSMSGVYINGLKGLQKIVSLKYTNNSDIKAAKANKDANRMIEIIEESITDIEKGNERGGYFPQVQFDTMMQIKDRLSKAMNANIINRDYAFSDMVDNVIAKIDINKIPAHAQKKNPLLEKYWEKDPLMVLKEYGDQASQFNKTINTQITYLEALKNLPKSDTEFQKGLRRFIEEEYTVFTRGTTGRADWANQAVTTLNAVQTARTMGINITGAVKNAASAIHFYSRVGLSSLTNARKAMNHDVQFQKMIKKSEEESGFLFTDAAQELYTEGLITRKDLQSGKIEFDPLTGKIMMENTPVQDMLKKAGQWTIDKGLFFHRLTENNQRKWMFRTALHRKYSQLVNDGYSPDKAKNFAQSYALKMVNSWAYEYAAHAKSKLVRGEWRTVEEIEGKTIQKKLEGVLGATSEVSFHLLHYPMSLMESHYDALKGIHKSLLARQGLGSEEIQYAMRYAGVSGLVALASVLTNTDFSNIIENESVDRIKRIVDDLTEYDNPDRGTFGLMSELTGPTLGTIKHLMIANEIIDIDNNDLNKILFGNVDFADPNDSMAERYNAYQWSTFWGTTKNKIYPAIQAGRGRDLLTHYLKLYPNTWTKQGHSMIFGKKTKKKKRRSSRPANVDRALAVLEGMRR